MKTTVVTFLTWICVCHTPAYCSGNQIKPADSSVILSLFDRLNGALKSQDKATVLACFSQADSDFFNAKSHQIASLFDSKNSSSDMRVRWIEPAGSSAEALVFVQNSYDYNDRRSGTAYWVSYELKKIEGQWLITAETIRDYAKPGQIDLNVELLPEAGEITGSAVIDYEIVLPGEDNLILTLNRGLEIVSMTDGSGKPLSFDRTGSVAVIDMVNPQRNGQRGRIQVAFRGYLYNEGKEQGYSQVGIAPDGCFASWVTNWYPMLDCETSKCAGSLTYTVPKGMTVVSSGLKTGFEAQGEKSVFRFTVSKPLNFSFAAADYTFLIRRVDDVDIGVYFLGGELRNAEEYIETCSGMISFFKGVFGFYPYDQYSVVEVPKRLTGTLGGSSEQGMNLFPEGMLPPDDMREYVIAHEIGHSWWGNWIRGGIMQTEAGAQFTASLWFEHKYGAAALQSLLTNGFISTTDQYSDNYFRQMALVPEQDRMLGQYSSKDRSIIHSLADMKGHVIYHMLRNQVGAAAFDTALKRLMRDYAGESVSLDEMREVFEGAGNQELKWFFDQWLFRTGAPEFDFACDIGNRGDQYVVSGQIHQSGDFYRVRSDIGVLIDGTWEIHPVEITDNPQPFELTVDRKPDRVAFDPFYRIFRWRPDLKKTPELKTVMTLNEVHQSDRALEKLQALLPELADSVAAKLLLGEINLNLNRLTDAAAAFQWVIDQDRALATGMFRPEVPNAMIKLGNCYDLRGERDQAVKMYQTVLDEPVMKKEFRVKAAEYLSKAYQPAPVYLLEPEKLNEYAGKYAIEALVFTLWVNEAGVLMSEQVQGPPMTLIPVGPDEFKQIGNETILVRFLRGEDAAISGIDVFENGKLLIPLKRL